MNDIKDSWKQAPRSRKLQYCCVLAVLLVELMYFSPPVLHSGVVWLSTDYFLMIPSGIFLLITLCRGINRKGRAPFALGFVMLVWAVAVEVLRLIFGMRPIAPGEIACYYALALPMAFALEDGDRQWGITAFAGLYVLIGIRLCVQAAGLILGVLPEPYSIFVCWDGARLLQMFHPTNCALILMLGMGFSLALCFRTKKRWLKGILIALTVIQFGVQSLTNGRNATGFTCVMMGGFLFCVIRGTGWKRGPVALAAGVTVAAVLFLTSQNLFAVHEQYMRDAATQAEQTAQIDEAVGIEQPDQNDRADQPEEEPLEPTETQPLRIDENGYLLMENVQQSLREDLSTFNGRTTIWKEAVGGVLRHPIILLCGTDSMAEVLAEEGRTNAEHTHNSYLETLYTLGVPGLLLGLAITLLALRAGVTVLWRNTDLWKSSVALITLCLLGSSMLEPYLFAAKNYHHYICVLFLTAVGYLHQWCTDMK